MLGQVQMRHRADPDGIHSKNAAPTDVRRMFTNMATEQFSARLRSGYKSTMTRLDQVLAVAEVADRQRRTINSQRHATQHSTGSRRVTLDPLDHVLYAHVSRRP